MLRILLIAKGGREYALVWKLSQSPLVEHIYAVPGNRGTVRGPDKASNVDSTKADDYPALMELSENLQIGLFVAGTDQAVVDLTSTHHEIPFFFAF